MPFLSELSTDLSGRLFVGLVVENVDPNRKGRIKVRVQNLFDELPIEQIPYASPLSGLAGKSFEVPAVGKIVSVLFANECLYDPYYLCADNYNVNLKNKLDSLSDDEYRNFISLAFDHRTQIYSDDTNLTLDYQMNKITIDNISINHELKDNNQMLNLGSAVADQQAILGNHWIDWFDKFVNALLLPTSLVGNLGASILKPQIDQLLTEYQAIRDTFLSKNVNIVDNGYVDMLKRDPKVEAYQHDASKINGNVDYTEDVKTKIVENYAKDMETIKESIPTTVTNEEKTMAAEPSATEEQNTEVRNKIKQNEKEFGIPSEDSYSPEDILLGTPQFNKPEELNGGNYDIMNLESVPGDVMETPKGEKYIEPTPKGEIKNNDEKVYVPPTSTSSKDNPNGYIIPTTSKYLCWSGDYQKKYGVPSRDSSYLVKIRIPDDIIIKGFTSFPLKDIGGPLYGKQKSYSGNMQTFTCNIDMVRPFINALKLLKQRNIDHLVVQNQGCLVIRDVRDCKGTYSPHSWGIAFDINTLDNQMYQKPNLDTRVVQAFKDSGFEWGGEFRRFDGMHFQLSKAQLSVKTSMSDISQYLASNYKKPHA